MCVLCWLILTINLTQPKFTWRESFNKELHRASWPVGMSGGGGVLIDVGSSSPLWVVPFPSQEGPEPQKKGQSELSASKDVFIFSLSLSVDLM